MVTSYSTSKQLRLLNIGEVSFKSIYEDLRTLRTSNSIYIICVCRGGRGILSWLLICELHFQSAYCGLLAGGHHVEKECTASVFGATRWR